MTPRSIRWAPGLGTVIAMLGSGASAQETADVPGVVLTAATSVTRDDNFFRLPDGADPRHFGLKTGSRGDTIIVPSVSADANLLYSRQRILLSGTASRDLLHNNPTFDQTDLAYRVSWLWQFGNEWSGELTDSQQQQRTSFADTFLTQPNRQTSRARHASVNFAPRPDRRAGLIYDETRGGNSLGVRQINDYRITVARAELGIDSGLGHELVFGASSTHADYPNEQIVALAPVDNSYRQAQFDLSSLVALSEKTQLKWRIGYAKRHHPDVPKRNFSGLVGDLGLNWAATAKVQARLAVIRDLNAAGDYNRIYTVTTATLAELRYAPTFKTQFAVSARSTRVDYKGDPQSFFTRLFGPARYREDHFNNIRASFTWTPRDRVSVQLAENLDTRSSNVSGFQYRDWTTELDVQYRIGP